ncbi:GMC family oxidoreductase N-terminal domain-containing protein, partial [Streptomyces sp. NPDC057757]|uniref:GMC family oxidoreductase N-terminal domain-containing protein n=1 Tax=Streptomyces sp. NPDC057757 TaxID=3346241 RepID=UPI0036BFF197
MLPDHATILVLGGGTAGCVVAGRMARHHDVLVLEAGPDYGPENASWPAELLDATTLPVTHDWGYREGRLAFDRCRVIGGCSTHNGCTQSVGWAGDYDAWAAAGSPGWDAKSLTPYFKDVAETLRFRHFREGEIQPFQQAFIGAAQKLGIPARDDLDDLEAGSSVGCAPVNITPGGVRVNTAFGYLDPMRESGRLTVAGGVTVDRVVLRGDRAVAVDVRTEEGTRRIHADLIVVAAGAYGTPEILLRSGIGPATHLRETGVPVTHHLPGV